MKTFLFLAGLLALAPVALSKNKVVALPSPEVPPATTKPVASPITLNVRQASSARTAAGTNTTASGAVRYTMEHREAVEVTVANQGTQPETVKVEWFWVGRDEKTKVLFRTGDGEKTLTLPPGRTEPPFLASAEIEEHRGKKPVAPKHHSGGHLVGWVVTAHNAKGDLVAVRTSDAYLEGYAAVPPSKRRH